MDVHPDYVRLVDEENSDEGENMASTGAFTLGCALPERISPAFHVVAARLQSIVSSQQRFGVYAGGSLRLGDQNILNGGVRITTRGELILRLGPAFGKLGL